MYNDLRIHSSGNCILVDVTSSYNHLRTIGVSGSGTSGSGVGEGTGDLL